MAREFVHSDGAQWTVTEYRVRGGAGFRALGEGLKVDTLKLVFTRTGSTEQVTAMAQFGFMETASDDQLRALLTAAQKTA